MELKVAFELNKRIGLFYKSKIIVSNELKQINANEKVQFIWEKIR